MSEEQDLSYHFSSYSLHFGIFFLKKEELSCLITSQGPPLMRTQVMHLEWWAIHLDLIDDCLSKDALD